MERVQQDMTPHMRAILVDWLVEVAMEYRLCSDTLHLTVALLDRFLSVARIGRDQLQLAGIACMWAAAKYEEIYAPSAREFCFITDNTYTPKQVRARWGGAIRVRMHANAVTRALRPRHPP
jgi:cyclin A